MNIALVDHLAHNGDSIAHRMPAGRKMLLVVLLLAAMISARQLETVLVFFALLLGAAAALRIPLRILLLLSVYPAMFIALIAVGGGFGNVQALVFMLCKVLACALLGVLLILTTPYPAIMHSAGLLLPKRLQQSLMLLYRSLFILLDTLGHVLNTLRLRNTTRRWRPLHQLHCLATALGLLFIRAYELSEHYARILQLRGYDGKALLYSAPPCSPLRQAAYSLAVGVAALVLFTVRWQQL